MSLQEDQPQPLLDDVVKRLAGMGEPEKQALREEAMKHPVAGRRWVPNEGPQYAAYVSEADEMLYGGQAGGGKSGLLVGLALTQHTRSLLMRRQYTDLSALIEDMLEKHGSRKGFSGAPPAKLRPGGDRLIEFGSAKTPGDEQHWKGQPHDLLGIDEASQWLEGPVRFLMGWVRSINPSQRCRTILATNPPEMPGQGQWLIKMFAPWLDKTHELYPTKAGELLWYVVDVEGRDQWVDGPEPVTVGERLVQPISRTFIPAALSDNPYLKDTDYAARLDALQEPLRSAIRDGNWMISHHDDEFQVIPTNWVLAAQERWTRDPPEKAPMCAIGVDVAQGGENHTVVQCRYDYWLAEPISVPGSETPLGSDVAALVVKHRRNKAAVIIDMGGGYGGGPYEHLMTNLEGDGGSKVVYGFNGAEPSHARTADRQLGFMNKRAEAFWRFREALDPDQEQGSPVMIPPDSELVADLVSALWELTPRGIKIEPKENIIARLGRSPDKGDAAIMAWHVGPSYVTHHQIWKNVHATRGSKPRTIHGYEGRKKRRH